MSIKTLYSITHSSNFLCNQVWCINWNYGGRILASCGDDKTIKIWALTDENELKLIKKLSDDHTRTIRYVEFSKNGQNLACSSFDSTITIYNYKDGDYEEAHKLSGHENEVKCSTFSVSDEFLATCSRDKTVWICKSLVVDDEYEVSSILQTHSADVKFVVWNPAEDILVSGGYDCSVRFYKYDGEDWIIDQIFLDAHENTVWSGSFNSTGNFLATCGADLFVKIWKKHQPQNDEKNSWTKFVEYKVNSSKWPLYSIDWSPLNDLIAVGSGDCNLRILRFDEENLAITLVASKKLNAEINCVRWNPKFSNFLAVACDDGSAQLFEITC